MHLTVLLIEHMLIHCVFSPVVFHTLQLIDNMSFTVHALL